MKGPFSGSGKGQAPGVPPEYGVIPMKATDKEGFLFILPWALRHSGAGVDEVVGNLVREVRRDDRMQPLLWASEALESQPCEIVWASKPLIEPLDDQRPIRAMLAFLVRLPVDLLRLTLVVNRRRIRVVNIHYPPASAVYWVLLSKLRLFAGTLLISIHGSDIATILQSKTFRRTFWRFVLRGADEIVTCSRRLAQEVRRFDPDLKPVVIQNGMDVDCFRQTSRGELHFLAELENTQVILQLGGFVRMANTTVLRKGQDLLVRAFESLAERFPEAVLVLAGTGPCLEEVRQMVESAGLSGRVLFPGHVPHECVGTLLGRAQVFVLASRYEGFPIAILEAAAARTPIVTTDTGGAAELIEDNVTGRLIAVDDVGALTESISDCLINPIAATTRASNCYSRLLRAFTWQMACQKYLSLAGQSVVSGEDVRQGRGVGSRTS